MADPKDRVDVAHEPGIVRLRLNRPDKLNALDRPMLRALRDGLIAADDDETVKAVVLSGTGRAFSAGADLGELHALGAQQAAKAIRERAELAASVLGLLESIRPITIAAVHGATVGGAFALMLGCDLRVADASAVFSLPEAKMGGPLGWGGIPRCVREIGAARTMELVLTARPVGAQEALAMGLINQIAETAEVGAAALAATLVERSSMVLRTTKRHVRSVANGIADPHRSFADDDTLVLGLLDPDAAAARAQHSERFIPAAGTEAS